MNNVNMDMNAINTLRNAFRNYIHASIRYTIDFD